MAAENPKVPCDRFGKGQAEYLGLSTTSTARKPDAIQTANGPSDTGYNAVHRQEDAKFLETF